MTLKKPIRPPPREPLQLTLLENGIDFVNTAVNLLYSDDTPNDTNYKYAVLHIFSGTLLLLKERLRLAHASLIWTNVAEMGDTSKATVDFSTCIERLTKCASIKFNDSQLRLLRRAQQKRNQLEHYSVELNLNEAEKLVAEMVEFIFFFLRDELNENLENDLPLNVWQRVQELQQIAKRIHKEREQDKLNELEAAYQRIIKRASPARVAWLNRAHPYEMLSSTTLEALNESDAPYDIHAPPKRRFECMVCGGYDSVSAVAIDIAICTVPTCRTLSPIHQCAVCDSFVLGDDNWCQSCTSALADSIGED
ncbi:hypothetical protein [Corallococcus terminator]|uniref:hypothetical protein n=1 Tax=Corallococcus terminator TaxID=2316733 RepID=UPI0011C48EEF|nr:hypothetical protein [Corallococcus terminator]